MLPRISVERAGITEARSTLFRELRNNAAISENQWRIDKELFKELWGYLEFFISRANILGSHV